jgi:hypothetical protein
VVQIVEALIDHVESRHHALVDERAHDALDVRQDHVSV